METFLLVPSGSSFLARMLVVDAMVCHPDSLSTAEVLISTCWECRWLAMVLTWELSSAEECPFTQDHNLWDGDGGQPACND